MRAKDYRSLARLRRMGAARARTSAFTLLEVMLAIAIFAGVLAAIYTTWTSILRSSQVAQVAAAEVQRSRMAARALEEALLGAQVAAAGPSSRLNRQNESYYSFLASGDPDEPYLSFVARLPESYPRGGHFDSMRIRRLTFNLERDWNGGSQLVLRQTPLLFEPDRDEEENPLVLARNVQEFTLEFWDVRTEEWQTEWAATNRLPPMVRFFLATGRSSQEREPPTARVVPLAGSGALTGIRSVQQAPEVESVNPTADPGSLPPPPTPPQP